ncbi:glypican-3-like isoform X2 [Acipenser ruthenus]|uniref:glypican-3-like isoform X2 n=1 Tax=Acipenser ruthenus TaxID=7906 RepID=UPI002742973C|nr:glypican-3-like isoform X2 [Acipenser ruthenus]
MAGSRAPGVLLLGLLQLAQSSGQVPSCLEVRSSFQLLHPGVKWAPEKPVSEAFDVVVRHARNYTALLFRGQWAGLAGEAWGPVTQLFKDVSLYILGLDTSVDDMVNSFFDSLFPAVYRRLLSGPAGGSGDQPSEECLRAARRDTGAFGPLPKLIMTRMSRSLLAARVFLQALNLGIEVVNTTDHLRFGKDCGRTLLRLWYCPHCQGLLEARPCLGFCQAVMQGCLLQLSEVQPYWQGYIEGLAGLAGGMQGVYDLENVLLKLHTLVRDAVLHAHRNRLRLAALVSGMCGRSSQRLAHSPKDGPAHQRGLKSAPVDPHETLAGRRREFIDTLQGFTHFYSSLPEALCSRESAVLNDSLCWNGQDIAERYPPPGVKKVQTHSPDTKPKALEPVINQIIDKLKHINQLLRRVSAPRRRVKGRPAGGELEEEALESGDCDDEDECSGSGQGGAPPYRRRLRIFTELADDLEMDDIIFHKQLLPPHQGKEGRGSRPLPGCSARPVSSHLAVLAVSLTLLGPH